MGVTNRSLIRRLRAWSIGGPVARGTTIQTAVTSDETRFLLAFVRMGGESRPWALAWKRGRGAVKFRSVGEPRAREFVDEILVDLAEDLIEHLELGARAKPSAPTKDWYGAMVELPQVWVPNSSHMLHFIAYTYIRRKGDGEADKKLRLLGRIAMHLFLESRRPGQQVIIDSTAALRSAFDFPCEDARQAHLGLLIAWLDNRGERDNGLAAALEAERLPVGITLDPALERRPLNDLVDKYNASRKSRGRGSKTIERQIAEVLRPELERRVDLVERAIDYINEDERDFNGGLDELSHATSGRLYWELQHREVQARAAGKEPFSASPETDWDARGATNRYFQISASQDRERNALIHFDRELEAEAINAGSAFRGVITHVADEGEGKAKVPVWTIVDQTPGALSLRQWDKVCVVGAPKRSGVVREIVPSEDGSLSIIVEITNGTLGLKGRDGDQVAWPHRMTAIDSSWLGQGH